MKYRYLTLLGLVSILALSVLLVRFGRLKSSFFPAIDAEKAAVALVFTPGTPFSISRNVISRVEDVALTLQEKYRFGDVPLPPLSS